MELSWDIVVWTKENAIDYVPTSWSNETKTKYKYPVSYNALKIKKMIDLNMGLENGKYEWLEAVCKAESVKDLQIAKELCEKGTYTSNLEISDQEYGSTKRKRKKFVRRQLYDTSSDLSEDSDNMPLARGQNLLRKTFSTPVETPAPAPPVNEAHQTVDFQDNTPKQHFRGSNLTPTENQNSRAEKFSAGSTRNNNREGSSKHVEISASGSSQVFSDFTPKGTTVKFRNQTEPGCSNSSSRKVSSDLTNYLLEELTEIKFYMKESRATLSRIENLINIHSNKHIPGGYSETVAENPNVLLGKLPCQTKTHLEEIDSLITENPKYMRELVNFLYLAGGSTPHRSVYMAMQKIFGKELALLYSGQGKKKKIPFCNMKIYEAVFAAIRKRHSTVTDEALKKSVSLFLATAKSRLSGKDSSRIAEVEPEPDEEF